MCSSSFVPGALIIHSLLLGGVVKIMSPDVFGMQSHILMFIFLHLRVVKIGFKTHLNPLNNKQALINSCKPGTVWSHDAVTFHP